MNTPVRDPAAWTRGRFLAAAGVLFVLQIGLIFLFAARVSPPRPAPPPPPSYRAFSAAVSEEQLLRTFFVGEPDIFLTPNSHGFSGRGWMNQPPPQYQPTNQLEEPDWLPFLPDRLGTVVPLKQGRPALPPMLAEPAGPETEPLPIFLPPRIVPAQSVFNLEGEVSARLAGDPPALRSWPSAALLSNSVVQIAVTPAGDVIAARLLARSGLADADADALAKARTLQFRPSSLPGVKWARAVFQWRTEETAPAEPQK